MCGPGILTRGREEEGGELEMQHLTWCFGTNFSLRTYVTKPSLGRTFWALEPQTGW